jgi:hypothetical protein
MSDCIVVLSHVEDVFLVLIYYGAAKEAEAYLISIIQYGCLHIMKACVIGCSVSEEVPTKYIFSIV